MQGIKSDWKGKTGGGRLGQKALFFLLRVFSIRFLYAILYLVIPFYMLFRRKAFKANYAFYKNRLGYNYWDSFCGSYKSHYAFGQLLIDRFAVFAGKQDYFKLEVEGLKYFDEAMNDSRSCLIAVAHFGNFEILGYLLKNKQKTINVLSFGGEGKEFQKKRDEVLKTQNIRLLPIDKNMQHIYSLANAVSSKEAIAIHCDRMYMGGRAENVDFLGKKARFSLGPFQFADKHQMNKLFMAVVKENVSRYKVFVIPIVGASSEELLKNYVSILSDMTKKYPSQWFNFYDFWHV